MPAPAVSRLGPMLALALCAASPVAAQAGWSDAGWSARCASTSVLTRLSSISRGWARPADCLFSYIDPRGTDRMLLVSAETRRAVEAVLDDIADWYDRRGFPAPLVRRAGDPPLALSNAQWRAGYVEIEAMPHDPGRGDRAFEVLLDPMPDPEGDHEHAEGFYDGNLRVMVVRLEPVEPASSEPEPGATGRLVGLALADPDTLAHEMFHAISRGLHGGNFARFVEEGLAEMYGVLYAAERSGRPGPHWLTARFGDGRFSRAPLMSDDGGDPYDTAPFWRFIHDRLGSDAGRWIVALLRDHDQSVPVNASGAVDAWLRDTLRQPLNHVWAEFLQQVSREATRAGVMDTLVECLDITLAPTDEDPERIFDRRVAASGTQRYTARCLRVTLPLVGDRRELVVEGLNGEAEVPGLRIVIEGVDLIGRPYVLSPSQTEAELIVFPWRDDDVAVPARDMQPGFRVVLKGLATGCQGERQSLRRAPERLLQRVQAGAGDWQQLAMSYGHVGPAPNCGQVQFDEQRPGHPDPMRFTYDGGVLVLPRGAVRLVPFQGPPGHRQMVGLSEMCGPLLPAQVAGTVQSPDDWVRAADPDPQYFRVEVVGECDGYAAVGPNRAAVAIPVYQFMLPGAGRLTPEFWEVMLYQRPD